MTKFVNIVIGGILMLASWELASSREGYGQAWSDEPDASVVVTDVVATDDAGSPFEDSGVSIVDVTAAEDVAVDAGVVSAADVFVSSDVGTSVSTGPVTPVTPVAPGPQTKWQWIVGILGAIAAFAAGAVAFLKKLKNKAPVDPTDPPVTPQT